MGFNYSGLGSEALYRLRRQSFRAFEVQRQVLREIMIRNRNTEIGRQLGFAGIRSVQEYQSRVPVSEYHDYAGQIDRMLDGQTNLLTADDAV